MKKNKTENLIDILIIIVISILIIGLVFIIILIAFDDAVFLGLIVVFGIYILPLGLFLIIRSIVRLIKRANKVEYQEDFDFDIEENDEARGTIFTPIRRFYSRKKQKEFLEKSLQNNANSQNTRTDRFGNIVRNSTNNNEDISVVELLDEEEVMQTEHLIYSGKLVKKSRCGICKLELNNEDSIFTCPFCQILFHSEHLIDWLQTNKKCPICGKELV